MMILPFNQKQHLRSIVDLHYKELPWTPNSRIGKEHLYKLYKNITDLPSSFGFVYLVNERVIGFSLISLNNIEMRNILEECFKIKDLIQLLKLSISDPNIFIDIMESKFIIPIYLKKIETTSELVAWVVDRNDPLSGTAAIECFFRAKKFFREHNKLYYIGQVDVRCKEANQFWSIFKNIKKKKFICNNIYLIKS